MTGDSLPHVVQVGLGPLGERVVADLCGRGLARVVEAVDADIELAGRHLGDLVRGASQDVIVRSSVAEIRDWTGIRAAIVTTSSDLELCMDTFRALLPHGLAVVSTCEELSWPWLRHPILAQELDELCVRHGSRILGTGINPGFLMDTLPVAVTQLCNKVRSIRVERVQDAALRRLPFQRKVGIGLDADEFDARVQDGSLRHVGLGESLHFVAHFLGWKLDRWEEDLEPVPAEHETDSGLGTIPPGKMRGVRQTARGWVGGQQVVELVFLAAAGEPHPHDRIEVDGDPSLDLRFAGGVHGDLATSAVVLNSLAPLLAARPALHTMGSLPIPGCKQLG